MADEFSLPGIDEPFQPDTATSEALSFVYDRLQSEAEFELPGIDKPAFGPTADLPTIESVSELPGDIGERFVRHAGAGVNMFLEGLASVVPGTPETIWRGREEGESMPAFLASKVRPLGIAGGPLELLLSPATAVTSEAIRLGSEAERKLRGLGPEDTPITSYAEPWASVPAGLVLGGVGPVRQGLMRFFLGPGRATDAQRAVNIAKRAQRGYFSSETVAKSLEKYAPSAREYGQAARTSQREAQSTSAMMRGHGGLEEALERVNWTPAREAEFWARGRGDIAAFTDPELQALEPVYQSVFEAGRGLRPQLASAVGLRGKTLEGQTVEFTPRPGFYAPKVYEAEESQRIREFIEASRFAEGKPITVKRGVVMGEEQPFMANAAYARSPEGEILGARHITDVPRAVRLSIENFSQTLGRARAFGPEGEKLNDILARITTEIGGPEGVQVNKILLDTIKRDLGPGAARSAVLDSLRVFEATTKMPFSFIANATQSFITAVVAGARATTQAVVETVYSAATRGELPAIVKELGLINKTVSRSLQHEISGAAPSWLRRTGEVVLKPFEWVERFNQVVAARAGELATQRFADKLARTGNLAPREWRWLANSDLDIAAIRARGSLLPHEVKKAAWSLVDRTQFLARPTAMPYLMRSSPLMRIVFQMKTFAARATEAIYREVVKEAAKGNWNPFLRLVAYYPIGGELARQVGGRLRGRELREIPDEWWEFLKHNTRNMLYVGGFGVASDSIIALAGGMRPTQQFLLGPGITDVAQEVTEGMNLVQHYFNRPEEQAKFEATRQRIGRGWARKVPFFGPSMAERMKTLRQKAQTKPY